jgi:hypothetical protein
VLLSSVLCKTDDGNTTWKILVKFAVLQKTDDKLQTLGPRFVLFFSLQTLWVRVFEFLLTCRYSNYSKQGLCL